MQLAELLDKLAPSGRKEAQTVRKGTLQPTPGGVLSLYIAGMSSWYDWWSRLALCVPDQTQHTKGCSPYRGMRTASRTRLKAASEVPAGGSVREMDRHDNFSNFFK